MRSAATSAPGVTGPDAPTFQAHPSDPKGRAAGYVYHNLKVFDRTVLQYVATGDVASWPKYLLQHALFFHHGMYVCEAGRIELHTYSITRFDVGTVSK